MLGVKAYEVFYVYSYNLGGLAHCLQKEDLAPKRHRKMDGVEGLEPSNDRIKIYCLTNLAIPQQNKCKNQSN